MRASSNLSLSVAVTFAVCFGTAPSAAWTNHRGVGVGGRSCGTGASKWKASDRRAGVSRIPTRDVGSSPSCLFNVPPPSETDATEFARYASKKGPPASFYELQRDCVQSVRLALRDGHKLLDVEFPPLPAEVLEMDDVSAYDVAEANLKLATDFAKGMLASSAAASSKSAAAENDGDEDDDKEDVTIRKVAIIFPDEPEKDFAVEKAGSDNPYPGVIISSVRESDPRDTRFFKPEQTLLSLFGGGSGGIIKSIPDVDMYVCLTFSAQELPDLEELHNLDPSVPLVCYNLKLDVLRGDLGAPAFPGKDFQDRFMSRIKPAYYLRTRQYSRSTARPPFVVNYQGCLFRSYPGQFQTLLDTGNGKYRRLCGVDVRPALGQFKEQLTDALKEQGILAEESSALNFLRTGYKTTTWWEEERENASDAWRT